MKNEKTSPRVAKEAGKLLASCDRIDEILDFNEESFTKEIFRKFKTFVKLARSVSASALTQARDRKGKR